MSDRRINELDEAHEDLRRSARLRIDMAEQYIGEYRSRVRRVQEHFYDFAARQGVSEDPAFRDELQRASHIVDENVARAGRGVAELEEEYDQLVRDQSDERERYLAQRDHEG